MEENEKKEVIGSETGEQEERPGFTERLQELGDRNVGFLNRSLGGKLSWGVILLIAFGIYALVNIAITVTWIFK